MKQSPSVVLTDRGLTAADRLRSPSPGDGLDFGTPMEPITGERMGGRPEDSRRAIRSEPVVVRTLAMTAGLLVLLAILPANGDNRLQTRAERLMRFAKNWQGTPYVLGGRSKTGIDCSGYIQLIYRQVFRVDLPRATVDQIRLGVPFPINPENLREGLMPGDLLFFVSRDGHPRHVVLYLEDGLVTHSVSGRGVVIEPIESVAGRFIAPRRVIRSRHP